MISLWVRNSGCFQEVAKKSLALQGRECYVPGQRVVVVNKCLSRHNDHMASGMSQMGCVHQWAWAAFSSELAASNRWGERQLGSHMATIGGKTGTVLKAWCSPWVERALSNGQQEGDRWRGSLRTSKCFPEVWPKARVMLQDFPEGNVLDVLLDHHYLTFLG